MVELGVKSAPSRTEPERTGGERSVGQRGTNTKHISESCYPARNQRPKQVLCHWQMRRK